MAKTISSYSKSNALLEISKLIDRMSYKTDRYTLLTDIFEISAIGISNQFDRRTKIWRSREERYRTIMQKYSKEDAAVIVEVFGNLFKLLSGMSENGFDDYLGKLYMMSGTSSDSTGQFFTPYHVSKMCAMCTVQKQNVEKAIKESGIVTLHEPACGSGGMLLAALDVLNEHGINYTESCFIDCGDIDSRCVHMAYIQLSLAGVPAVVRHCDTLAMKQWDEWHTPALCMQYMKFRKYLR